MDNVNLPVQVQAVIRPVIRMTHYGFCATSTMTSKLLVYCGYGYVDKDTEYNRGYDTLGFKDAVMSMGQQGVVGLEFCVYCCYR